MPTQDIKPFFAPSGPLPGQGESGPCQTLIESLSMIPHIEGGYFVETDRDPFRVPSPFPVDSTSNTAASMPQRPGFDPAFRNASTSIHCLLTPVSPQGNFHRNRARTVHTLHRGRGRYVVIHADEDSGSDLSPPSAGKRIEMFVIGQRVDRGEQLQWIVEGGKYKASFLLPDDDGEGATSEGLLISETVVPGFEYCDHDFLTPQGLADLVAPEYARALVAGPQLVAASLCARPCIVGKQLMAPRAGVPI